MSGVFHVAGSVRTNPLKFVEELAGEFNLPAPNATRTVDKPRELTESAVETSLRTDRIRDAVGVHMPTLADSLWELREQDQNGFRQQLRAEPLVPADKVA